MKCAYCGRESADGTQVRLVTGKTKDVSRHTEYGPGPVKDVTATTYGDIDELSLWFCCECQIIRGCVSAEKEEQDEPEGGLRLFAVGILPVAIYLFLSNTPQTEVKGTLCLNIIGIVGAAAMIFGLSIFLYYGAYKKWKPTDFLQKMRTGDKSPLVVFLDILPYLVGRERGNTPFWSRSNWDQSQAHRAKLDTIYGIETGEIASDEYLRARQGAISSLVATGNLKKALQESSHLGVAAAAGSQYRRSGGFALVKASVLEKMMRFDEAYCTYCEATIYNADLSAEVDKHIESLLPRLRYKLSHPACASVEPVSAE